MAHCISTTITKKFFDLKMEDLKRDGYFIEYKEVMPYWKERIFNLYNLSDGELVKDIEIVFLIGNNPRRFKVEEFKVEDIALIPNWLVPYQYRGAINTKLIYAIKCVPLEAKA